ncbi:uncharacterized protein LOC108905165 [Anoplophora glabripennis]|uniref:uncharacterized protein LOC108905165 n=1 Tax=Anoplophora glabripennis TaxID=217634 RepID=UPI0008739394|nr:uncharacterized protein LOC108905165 [Anoplophora glabripennis]
MDKFLLIPTILSWYNLLILLVIVTEVTVSLEEPHPEIFLQPRNFNPHPYEVAAQNGERNGPVLFPPNPDDNLVEDRSNFVTPRNFPIRDITPVDSHPYVKVARKHKYRVSGRFSDGGRHVSNHARKALAKHASEVLSYPPEQLAKRKASSQQQGKDYAFSYKVVDHLRGDDFSHSQTRNSKATNGEYRVKLPDGRVQIVSYTADKNGYKADVKYTENEGVADQRGMPHQGLMEDVPLQNRVNVWLHHNFANRWIGRGGPVLWSSWSPDLTPLDYYLSGHMKGLVSNKPQTRDELIQNIMAAAAFIQDDPDTHQRSTSSIYY